MTLPFIVTVAWVIGDANSVVVEVVFTDDGTEPLQALRSAAQEIKHPAITKTLFTASCSNLWFRYQCICTLA